MLSMMFANVEVSTLTFVEIVLAFIVSATGPWFPLGTNRPWVSGTSGVLFFILLLLLILGR